MLLLLFDVFMSVSNTISSPFHSFVASCSVLSGMEEAKVRCFVLWIVSMPLGFLMYYGLHPSKTSATLRHIYATTLGVIMGLLCFGWEMLVVFAAITISYAILLLVPPRLVQRVMMVYIVVITACAHLYRMVYDYGGYTVDYTIPLMMLVQKFSLTAYALHDGLARKYGDLSEDQRKTMIDRVPSVLCYFSYCFNFFHFLTGPICTVNEYASFIDGSNFCADNRNMHGKDKLQCRRPSTILPWLQSVVGAAVAVAIFLSLSRIITLESNIDPEQKRNFFQRLLYSLAVAFVLRCRYYMGWKFIEASCNAAGMGYSGCDDEGNPQWEVSKNCRPMDYEFATSIRGAISSWNITTNTWLRRVCYDRVPFQPTLMTFVLSAFWHGFYPGYYFCFVSLAILVAAARKGRSIFRPYFIGNTTLKFIYDIITFVLTTTFLNTCGLSFQYLYFTDAVKNFTNLYCLQIFIPIVFLLLPLKAKRRPKSDHDKAEKNAEKQPDVKTSYREGESESWEISSFPELKMKKE